MLQSFVLGQPCVLVVDHAKLERYAVALVAQLSSTNSIDVLPNCASSDILPQLDQFLDPQIFIGTLNQSNVLIKVAEFTTNYTLKCLFQLVHSLKTTSTQAKPVWLWATPPSIRSEMVVPYLEHMSSVVIILEDSMNMSVLSKKSGGNVTKKLFTYRIKNNQFEMSEAKKETAPKETEPSIDPESLTTFKINVDEEELEARNTLKLPYERTSDVKPTESKIIYHPDADDDFDEEDPDDDLNI